MGDVGAPAADLHPREHAWAAHSWVVELKPQLFEDTRDLVDELKDASAEFIVVGAHAMAAHGVLRATGDFDIWVRPTLKNAERVVRALVAFGAPLSAHGVTAADLSKPDVVYQMGLPPRRIDVLTSIDGVSFEEAWQGRVRFEVDGVMLFVLGRAELLRNKLATGRAKDRLDARLLTADD